MNKNRLYILFTCLAISAIVMFWDSSEEILTPPRASALDGSQFPYAVARDASTSHYDDKGRLDYAFTAEILEHFRIEQMQKPVEEYTLMHAPSFTLYDQQNPWHIEANQGRLQRVPEEITLWDKVRIWQTPLADANDGSSQARTLATELTTESLVINPTEKLAHTQEPVKILSAYGTIDAVGMTADFQNRKIRLHHRVKAIHKIPAQVK